MLTSSIAQDPPLLPKIDPYSLECVINPYPFHDALREKAPVVELENYGVYAVGRYEECGLILSNPDEFISSAGIGIQDIRKPGRFRIPSVLVDADPPDHTRVRSVMTRILSPKRIRTWRDIFEREAKTVVDKVLDMKRFDGMEDFVESYILTVFPKAMGIDLPRDAVYAIGEMRFNQTGPENDLYRAAMERAQPYMNWFEHSVDRAGVSPGSVSEEVYAAEERGELAVGAAKSVVRTLVGGGTDSTMSGMGACMYHLASNPKQMAIAVDKPEIMRTALDEGIRLESPFQILYRVVRNDMSFGSLDLKKNRKIGVWLGAANRDPRKWANPDSFDLARGSSGVHVAFGKGIHVCIGQMLARLEAECLLVEFARRAKALELVEPIDMRPMNMMRSLRNIPLHVTPK